VNRKGIVMTKQLRVKNVVAAIVHDPDKRFLVCFNRRWNQYAFPMTGTDLSDDRAARALKALQDHCPHPIQNASAKPLEYVGGFGPSWALGEDTYYNYYVYEVSADIRGWPPCYLGSWCGFLDYDQLMSAPLVSWSTKEIARGLMDNQEAAVALISPNASASKEYLLVEKASYAGYFFPSARVKTEIDPLECAIQAVQADTGYLGRIEAAFLAEMETQHFSPRYNRQRRYRFFLCEVNFPGVDLNAPNNAFEGCLRSNHVNYQWFDKMQLAAPAANGLSPTASEVQIYIP
jgi:hypothetical protein